MEKEKLESLIIDYIDGQLNDTDRYAVEQELKKSEEARKLYEQTKQVIQTMDASARLVPSSKLKSSFEQMLADEIHATKAPSVLYRTPAFYRVAAAVALLIVGGIAAFLVSRYHQQQKEIEMLSAELARTKKIILSQLGNDDSPGQRILGVKAAYQATHADNEIVEALITTMNNDANSNVRLAAIDALRRFHHEPKVRKALVSALSTQTDPIVQITLIQLMVEIKEKQAVHVLEKIIENEEVLPVVKDEAHAGIFRLS